MSSRYHEVYAAWKARPGGVLGRGCARRSTGTSPGTRCSIPTPANTAAGSSAPNATRHGIASTGTSRRGRGQQKALIYDSPVTKTTRAYTYAELRDEVATLGGVLQDLGVKTGDRVIIYMPMVPEAVIGHARLRPHRRHPFGGVRRLRRAGACDPHRGFQAGRHPVGLVRHRARPHRRSTSRCSTAPSSCPSTSPQAVLMLQRPMAEAAMVRRPRPRLGERRSPMPRRAAARPAASRSRPPTRSTSSTPPAPPASPRAWCATTAATWSRSSGP